MSHQRACAPTRRMRRTIPAKLSSIDTLCPELLAVLADNNTGKPACNNVFMLELMFREALDNAVIHGCKSDPREHVDVTARVTADRITICISDGGEGFDWRKRMLAVHDPLSTSGLGIPIMMKYSSRLRYNRRGNRLILEQRLAGGSNYDQEKEC